MVIGKTFKDMRMRGSSTYQHVELSAPDEGDETKSEMKEIPVYSRSMFSYPQAAASLLCSVLCALSSVLTLVVVLTIQRSSVDTSMDVPYVLNPPVNLSILLGSKSLIGYTSDEYSIQLEGENVITQKGSPQHYLSLNQSHQRYRVAIENHLTSPSALHAHGLTPPASQDGVPFVSSPPLNPSSLVSVDFPLSSLNQGTYFIHGHYGFQQGRGLAVPLVIHGEIPEGMRYQSQIKKAQDIVMMLQDFCPQFVADLEPPFDFDKKCSHESVFDQLKKNALEKDNNSSKMPMKCPGMAPGLDLDVRYMRFLSNSKTPDDPAVALVDDSKPIRLRIINAAGMTNFMVQLPTHHIIIAVDGHYVDPVFKQTPERIWIGVGQRIDILLVRTHLLEYPVVIHATAELREETDLFDEFGTALVIDREGSTRSPQEYAEVVKVQFIPFKDTKRMGFDGESALKALENNNLFPTKLKESYLSTSTPDRTVSMILTGHHGFESINGQSYFFVDPSNSSQSPPPNSHAIEVKRGELVLITIENHTMHPHSMHLHGHVFRVIALDGVSHYGALRDTVMIPGGCRSVTIAFEADAPGEWLFHCHMEFHMAAGMVTTVRYVL